MESKWDEKGKYEAKLRAEGAFGFSVPYLSNHSKTSIRQGPSRSANADPHLKIGRATRREGERGVSRSLGEGEGLGHRIILDGSYLPLIGIERPFF